MALSRPERTQLKPKSFSEPVEIFENEFLRLYSVLADFESHTREYFVTKKPDRAALLVLKSGTLLLVRQYRFLIDDWSWEIPGGGVGDETPQQAASRECYEESGIICNSSEPLFDYLVGTDVTDSHTYIFSSSDFTDTGQIPPGETDRRKWVPIERCLDMVFSGKIKDSMTIMALLSYSYTSGPLKGLSET